MITPDISIYDKNSVSATFFRTTSAIDVKDVYTSFILTVADNNFNLMKNRDPCNRAYSFSMSLPQSLHSILTHFPKNRIISLRLLNTVSEKFMISESESP